MAEILVKAVSAAHVDPVKDRRGCYKRGYPVVVMPDGHPWGLEERRPKFVVLKIPTIPVSRVLKYIETWEGVQRRRGRVRWDDLPTRAKNRLANDGELIIKAGAYDGTFDYTWEQVKAFFRNDETGLDETETMT